MAYGPRYHGYGEEESTSIESRNQSSYEESYCVEDQIISGSDLKLWIQLTCVEMVQITCSRYNGNEDNTFDGGVPQL